MIIINSLCWSVTLFKHSTTLTARTRNENRLAVWVILEIFWTVSLKAHDWSSWILTKCNLSWKIVKCRILSEVCMINSTVSPQMCCIKSIKGWFTHPQICWQEFLKLTCRTHKKFGLICFPRICFRGLVLWSRAIVALECDRRCLLFGGCTNKAVNSM